MRNVIFRRDRRFSGGLCPAFIYIDENKEFIGKLKNGKSLTIEIDNEEHFFYIIWFISTDPKDVYRCSEVLNIKRGNEDIYIRVKNTYSMTKGTIFTLIIEEKH